MTQQKICVTRKLPAKVEKRLSARFSTQLNPSDEPMTVEALHSAIRQFDALITTVSDSIDASLLATNDRRTSIIANVGVGYSNIDVECAQSLGIAVTNTPDVLTDATADVALLLILASTRRAYFSELKLRNEQWQGFSLVEDLGNSVQGKILGIIGMGRIGKATARRAVLGLGMKVVFYNRSPVKQLDFDATQLDNLDDVMSIADVVSVHIPGGLSKPLIRAEQIAKLKPTAHLINTARGDSIDQDALIEALVDKRIAGAGLDVFSSEPEVPQALRELDTVTLLPHIGSATEEVRTAMGMLAVDNVEAFFAQKPLPSPVV